MGPYRVMLLTMGFATSITFFITLFFVREIDVEDGQAKDFVPVNEPPWTIIKEVAITKTFWKYMLLTILTVNVRAVFRHLEATLPKYLQRTFGQGTSI